MAPTLPEKESSALYDPRTANNCRNDGSSLASMSPRKSHPFGFDKFVWDIYEMIISYLGIDLTMEVLGRLKPSINYILIYEHCGDVEFLRMPKLQVLIGLWPCLPDRSVLALVRNLG